MGGVMPGEFVDKLRRLVDARNPGNPTSVGGLEYGKFVVCPMEEAPHY